MSAPTCESCGAAVTTPKHGMGIGGGWTDLCESCASMLCACGGRVFANEAGEVIEPGERHTFDRCEVDGLTFARPSGCACDACNPDRQGVRP